MKAAIPVLICALCSAGFAQSHARQKPPAIPPAPNAYPLESLMVEGNHNYTAAQIFAVVGLHPGDKAGKAEFEAARDKLDKTGAFDSVSYRYAPSADAEGYDVVFEVREVEQVYPVRFADLPATDAQLRAWLQQKDPLFGQKIPATKQVVDRYVAWISEYLAKQNDHEPVAGQLSSDGGEDLALLFRPAKGFPAIAHVVFTNTGDITAGALQTAMYGVAIGVPYTEARVRQLLDNTIRPMYEARGLVRVAFPKIETAPAKDVDGVTVTVQVSPGPPYKLENASFTGFDYSRSDWRNLSKLKTDQTANFDEVRAAQERIRADLRRKGYLDASSTVARSVNDTDRTVGIEFEIAPGPRYTLGKLNIVGLDIESEPTIRKMWGIAPGRPFNPEYPDYFLTRVKQDGVFDNLKSTRAETNINAARHTVDVTLYFNK
jgi:outer membrane protein insertion porin family